MTAPLRLADDDGVPHEILRLRNDLAATKRMLAMAHEELEAERDARHRYFLENSRLKGQLKRQEALDAESELVTTIFNFWAALRGYPRNLKMGAKRVKAINARLHDKPVGDNPPTQPKDFIWPILGIVLDPFPKDNGIGFHDDLEVALRDDSQMYKYECRGREAVGAQSPRDVVETLGGAAALSALDALLQLQAEMYPPGQAA